MPLTCLPRRTRFNFTKVFCLWTRYGKSYFARRRNYPQYLVFSWRVTEYKHLSWKRSSMKPQSYNRRFAETFERNVVSYSEAYSKFLFELFVPAFNIFVVGLWRLLCALCFAPLHSAIVMTSASCGVRCPFTKQKTNIHRLSTKAFGVWCRLQRSTGTQTKIV